MSNFGTALLISSMAIGWMCAAGSLQHLKQLGALQTILHTCLDVPLVAIKIVLLGVYSSVKIELSAHETSAEISRSNRPTFRVRLRIGGNYFNSILRVAL